MSSPNRDFLSLHADLIAAINEEIASATAWAGANRDEAAALFSEASGIEIAAQRRSVDRAEFTFAAIDDKVIAEQQAVADRFERLGLIPVHVKVLRHCLEWKVKLLNSSHGQITLGRASVRKKLARRSPSIQRQRGQRK